MIVVHADVYRETHDTGSSLHVKRVWEEKSPSAQQISTSQFRTLRMNPMPSNHLMRSQLWSLQRTCIASRIKPWGPPVLQTPPSGHPVLRPAVLHPHPQCHIRFVDVIITTIMTWLLIHRTLVSILTVITCHFTPFLGIPCNYVDRFTGLMQVLSSQWARSAHRFSV